MLDVLLWRLRGVCFGGSALLSLGMGICSMSLSYFSGQLMVGIARPDLLELAGRRVGGLRVRIWLSIWHASSILWMAWDPYWLRRRNRSKTRTIGRRKWLVSWQLTDKPAWVGTSDVQIDMAIIYFMRLAITGSLFSSTFELSSISMTALRTASIIEIFVCPKKDSADDSCSFTHSRPSRSRPRSVLALMNLSPSLGPLHPLTLSSQTHIIRPPYLSQDKVRIPYSAYQPSPLPSKKTTNRSTNQWTGSLLLLLIDSDVLLVLMKMKNSLIPGMTGTALLLINNECSLPGRGRMRRVWKV